MEPHKDNVIAAMQRSKDIWEELKRRWHELGLPGSYSSPNEFVARLLLSQMDPNINEIVRLVKEAQGSKLAELRELGLVSSYISADDTAILALAGLLDGGILLSVQEPAPAPVLVAPSAITQVPTEKVKECPHCGHNFEYCHSGGYAASKTAEIATSPVAAVSEAEAEPTVEADQPKGCCHTDSQGRCTDCSDEETWDCDDCGETLFEAKVHKCKNVDECGHGYCDNCKENLNKYGNCSDCEDVQCDGCRDSVTEGEQKKCSNPECGPKEDYCDTCAERLLNKKGLCPECSGEELVDCADCREEFTESRLKKCRRFRDCGQAFCPNCTEGEFDEKGRCRQCQPE